MIPFGDIHRSSKNCHEEKWKEFLEWAKSKPRCYFLGMGDYEDFISSSERLLIGNGGFHNDTKEEIENWQERMIERFYKEIKFMEGKIVGLIEGNHFAYFQDGSTTTQRLCTKLKCKYLGANGFIRLIFKHKHHSLAVDVFAHHGLGSARMSGSSLSKVEQMAMIARADVFLMGHDHRKSIGMDDILEISDGRSGDIRLSNKKIVFARTGSFLRGYVPEKSSYVVDAGLKPSNLGTIKIEFTPKRITKRLDHSYIDNYREIDVHGSI